MTTPVSSNTNIPVKTIQRSELPLSCPTPDKALWDAHPRVYLPIESDPEHKAQCPYCGAQYQLVG